MRVQSAELTAGMWIGIHPSLQALLSRLEASSLEPGFALQRQTALHKFLQPYASPQVAAVASPLVEELALARLCMYVDYLPDDGQPSLIEQVRDTVDVHVPQEEREWLDPLRHSWMDLVTICDATQVGEATELIVRSLGNRREYALVPVPLAMKVRAGQILLTRLVAAEERHLACGTAVRLSADIGQAVFAAVDASRRELEVASGAFALADWQEFAKRFGYLFLWQVAQIRLARLVEAECAIRYCRADGTALLPGVALYDHCAFEAFSHELTENGVWTETTQEEKAGADSGHLRSWFRAADATADPGLTNVSRLTLTPTELWLECDSRDRLEALKHELAGQFGFRVHFRGEGWIGPGHTHVEPDLSETRIPARIVSVASDEERALWGPLLQTLYLDWADRPCAALDGQTPRHAASTPSSRQTVAAIINQLERDDPARRHTGDSAFDYDLLRCHVGL